jgi:hypothetical protein
MATPLFKKNLVKTPIERFPQRKVSFPLSPSFNLTFLTAKLEQEFDSHDRLVIKFAGKIEDALNFISSGDPVKFEYAGAGNKATWVGYVHKIMPSTVKENATTVICLSPTYLLKTTKQKIYKNVTADQIVQKICKQYVSGCPLEFNNCYKNGLLPIVLSEQQVDHLFNETLAFNGYQLTIDLEAQEVIAPDNRRYSFEIDGFRKYCLLNGLDDIGLTLKNADKIKAYEAERVLRMPWLATQLP